MGFYLRRSVSVGPFRFNLSGSGVGVSVGVPGFRVGSGPRGNYVHLGRGGVYYRHTFPTESVPTPSAPSSTTMQEIESGAAAEIVDASSEDLLEELRAKRRAITLRPFAIALAVLLLPIAFGTAWAFLLVIILGLALILGADYRDRIAKTVVILYELEPPVEEAFQRFTEWAQALASAGRMWHVAAAMGVHDRRYHAGASSLVQRQVTTVRLSEPPMVKTNVPVLSLGAGRQTLYFLPDRLLVCDSAGIGAISYRTLDLGATSRRFIEEENVPSDATVVDWTWQYVNKSGGPDRRFANNRQLPICLYDELAFRTSSGLNEVFQISRSGLAEGFVTAVRYLASVTP
ncbi:MAG TPA: DUF4236 domain-containing protein [Thermoanaerobaculia bacterium]|jgi:hypothetical protein|nr:DUF4236 domain-containing protein [Thermoanaerobaculia bacterium]